MMRFVGATLAGILLMMAMPSPASAHQFSSSYLNIRVNGGEIAGQWDIALRDLDYAIGLDSDNDGVITWGEVRAKIHDIEAYALSRLTVGAGAGDCMLQPSALLIDHHADGNYAVLRFAASCPPQTHVLTIGYRLLFDVDPTHRGLLTMNDNGNVSTAVLSPDRMTYTVVLGAAAESGFLSFLRLGIEHIVGGRDHLLFLAVLLLPAISTVRSRGIIGSLLDAGGLLSLFTLAHAVTVTLAVLRIIEVPAQISEAAIAFSIAVTAADNVWPFLGPRRGVIAFGFGLIHGLGFASALGPLAVHGWSLVFALVGFNTGIELVQLTLALIAFAVAYAIVASDFASLTRWGPAKVMLPLCSLVIMVMSTGWFLDRSFLLVTQQ